MLQYILAPPSSMATHAAQHIQKKSGGVGVGEREKSEARSTKHRNTAPYHTCSQPPEPEKNQAQTQAPLLT